MEEVHYCVEFGNRLLWITSKETDTKEQITKNELEAAIVNHEARYEGEVTEQSLCQYIDSKGIHYVKPTEPKNRHK